MELEKAIKKKSGPKPRLIECDGQKMTIKEYAAYCGVSPTTAWRRVFEKEHEMKYYGKIED